MMVAMPSQPAELDAHWQVLQAISPRGRLLDAREACELVPVLRRDQLLGAVYEPDAADMDVHAIHRASCAASVARAAASWPMPK